MPKTNYNKFTNNPKLSNSIKTIKNNTSKENKKVHRPFISFIQKLYTICNDEDIEQITWNPSGDKIKVYDSDYLCNNIFPTYFKHSCWASFTRQLNMYGFIRETGIYSMDNALIFYHPLFIKDRPDLIFSIQRRVLNQSNDVVNKSNKSNNNTTLITLNNKILQANKELMEVKQQLYDESIQNQNNKDTIYHNQSSMSYVKNLLIQIQKNNNDKHLNLELNIAIQSLELSLNFDHPNSIESSKSPLLSSNVTLSPIHNAHLSHNLRLPSINHLLKDLSTSHYA